MVGSRPPHQVLNLGLMGPGFKSVSLLEQYTKSETSFFTTSSGRLGFVSCLGTVRELEREMCLKVEKETYDVPTRYVESTQ